ncbi:hypothetical protein D3C72_1997610 [compost metagenome]
MPWRPGALPVLRKALAWLARMAMPTSSSAMSMCWPSPVRSRTCSAARMAVLAYTPVKRSVSATPTRSGPPPGSPSGRPVMLIMPVMAWIIRS